MGFSESDSSRCRRHPNLKQIPGVCSSCLREKLSKLNITSSSYNRKSTTTFISDSSSFSSTPPYSTAPSSATTTTGTRKSSGASHRRNGSEAYVSVGMVLNNGLKKSRSVSCANLSKTKVGNIDCISNEKVKKNKFLDDGQVLEEKNMKKKSGFLKKLINSATSKKMNKGGVLTHSKTMKEKSHNSSSFTSNANTKNKN